MGNETPPTHSANATPAGVALDADIIAIYRDSFTIFVQAHQLIAEFGGQMTFDVAPGGELLQVNARKNLGKVKIGHWQSIRARLSK